MASEPQQREDPFGVSAGFSEPQQPPVCGKLCGSAGDAPPQQSEPAFGSPTDFRRRSPKVIPCFLFMAHSFLIGRDALDDITEDRGTLFNR